MDRSWRTCGQAWIGLLSHVWTTGRAADDDRGPVIEAGSVLFEMAELSWDDPLIKRFGDAGKKERYTAKFTEMAVQAPFKYSYGARLRALQGVNQVRWVTDLLRHRPSSKSGWVSLVAPGEPQDAVPCLAAVAFRIRDRALHLTATFRSQNAFTAYLNYLPLRTIQSEVADDLGLAHGPMQVFVDVPHVYVSDLAEVVSILEATSEKRLPA